MGYGISAYLPLQHAPAARPGDWDEHEPDEIASVGRTAGSTLAPELFKALNAVEFDGHVSGNAGKRCFSRDEIVRAAVTLAGKLEEQPELARELAFLATILERMVLDPAKQYQYVHIWFC